METPLSVIPPFRVSLLLDLPMRDGNFACAALSMASALLLDLPMRDGNAGCPIGGIVFDPLLDLPMRDGNMFPSPITAASSPSFRPSYEGWKLVLRVAPSIAS